MTDGLYLHNTMTGRKQRFTPRGGDNSVKMFTCGPSIYSWPHIGNYRTFLYEDILQRYLAYNGYSVDRLINFTDVEDKAIAEAGRKNLSLEELTHPVAESFIQESRLLKIKLPDDIPRSSTSVGQAVHLIERLLEKGYAYRYGKDVFYDPLRFDNFGKLYGLDMSRWPAKRVRFRKDTYPGRRWNLGDFILWKGRRKSDGPVYWQTTLGEGRPAWNIQDPAMISKYLGYEVDICCGGIDNLYRHHDYNIAVIEGVSGERLADYWLHGEHVIVDGIKMSKSRGNIVYISDLLNCGFQPRHIRFFLIDSHYRSRLNLSDDQLHLARGKVDTFRNLVHHLRQNRGKSSSSEPAAAGRIKRIPNGFVCRMNDDLDVHGAFDYIYTELAKLAEYKAHGRLSDQDSHAAAEEIEKIDTVLRILD
ncbi:MAG: class I tRNA ligase family protein [Thermodesulfobacteriota bacterium]